MDLYNRCSGDSEAEPPEMNSGIASFSERRLLLESTLKKISEKSQAEKTTKANKRKTFGDFTQVQQRNSSLSTDFTDDFDFTDSDNDQVPNPSERQEIPKKSQVVCLLDEIIRSEKSYINNLQRGIGGYLKVFEHDIPATLKGRKFTIFGGLIEIYEFHSNIFLPKLKRCNGVLEEISNVFHRLITEDHFYSYVHYAMNNWKASSICKDHEQFFDDHREDAGDKLGIMSLLVQPIQRIPRYKLLFEHILDELGKQIEISTQVKSQLAAASRAWKAIEKLAVCVNASVNVKDITECYEISLPHQGKFRDMQAFEFHDNDAGKRFKGYVFLFEKCIVYTESKNNASQKNFIYRGHYDVDSLGIIQDVNHGKLSLFRHRLGQKQLDISGPSPTISKWNEYIKRLVLEHFTQKKQKGRFTWHGQTTSEIDKCWYADVM
ncbi:triple functional domain protein-like [Phlebotomus argentipes]|uniref:triple functional domain protein-like n=1 Tax=Phlebotomus argentipes TaxID=94469 RepID=UPI002892A581|nr:triple functional domain protein-like [Phlebotomus argentipes]